MKIAIKILSILLISLLFQSSAFKQTQTKDAILAKVLKYTRWSEMRITSHFDICVIGNSFDYYKKCFKKIPHHNGKEIIIRSITNITEIKSAEVLIISESEYDNAELILEHTKSRDILTIAEAKGMAEKGVILNIYSENDELIMEINEKSERASTVNLHPNLFRIAKVIR